MAVRQAGLKGGPELLAFLDAFPDRLVKGALRSGMTAAAKPIRDQARVNVRRKSGRLAKAIRTGSPRIEQDGTVTIRVMVDKSKPHGFLGHFIEYGVAPHFINAGTSGISARLLTRKSSRLGMGKDEETGAIRIGNEWVSGTVFHPGFPAMPFMRSALDMRAEDAVNALGARIRSYLSGKTGFTAPLAQVDDD